MPGDHDLRAFRRRATAGIRRGRCVHSEGGSEANRRANTNVEATRQSRRELFMFQGRFIAPPGGSLERSTGIAIDADRSYRVAFAPVVLQDHHDTLVDERTQLGVLAATFLDHRS